MPRKYDDVAEGLRAGEERETLQPFRPPSLESDVGVPLGTAAVFGIGGASLLVLLSVAVRWPAFTVAEYALTWAILAIAIVLLIFGWRTVWLQQTIMRWERETGKNLPGGYQGGPPPLLNPGAARTKAERIVVEREQLDEIERLTQFVTACATFGTSEQKLGIGTAPAAREAYTQQRDALMNLGLARWKKPGNPRAGWVLLTTPQQAREIIERHVVTRR